ncbi:polysaccharide deacetylase family protein [Phycisphaerales bacterium AB-hyl4]|uniref:Polysaccharide deacetylase family protein n=1 Tax=Natronomicrosphaera hydrolytica TaxID=3242702 RepID=A0ABV4U7G9_9BACT
MSSKQPNDAPPSRKEAASTIEPVRLVMSIDCEALQQSIADPALGERSTRGFADVLEANKLRGTFYVISPDLEAHAAVYRDLDRRGHEVGVHIHAGEHDAPEFLGLLSAEEQRRVIQDNVDRFAQVMGRPPLSVCLGYGSANDATYPLLADAGFRHGGASIPGRRLPQCASCWDGAPLDVHYAHRWFRMLPGDLDFVEIPPTVDPDSRMWGGKHCQDLRIELVDAKSHWHLMDKTIARQVRDGVAMPVVRATTHNIFEYDDPRNFRRQTLEGTIQGFLDICQRRELSWQTATSADVAERFRALHSLPTTAAVPELDTRGRQFTKA